MRKLLILAFLLSPFLASAQLDFLNKKMYFTDNSKAEYDYHGLPLDDVQFYISGEILLKREIDKGLKVQANNRGMVKFEGGKQFEYYQFNDGETCVFEYESGEGSELVLGLRFEEGDKMTLPFKITPETKQNENRYFQLMVGEDKKVMYGGIEYQLVYGDRVQLMFKEGKKSKTKTDKTKAKGMTVKQRKGGGL